MFLARNEDVPDILIYRYQRTGFNVVVATIRDKMFDGFARTWELLHLVKDDECVPSYEMSMGNALEVQEERIEVIKIFIEYPFEF